MIRWREGKVRELFSGWAGVQVIEVCIHGDGGGEERVRALAYPDLVGTPVVGDRVLLNTGAAERGLGTGGYALVIALPDRPAGWPGQPTDRTEAPGHLVKARYTPLQAMVLGVDDPEGEHHETLREADDLAGMPVVATDLHSALPAVLAGVRTQRPKARVAYVMSDGGALPLDWSRTVAAVQEAGWLAGTITTGQAFGGDLEAVTVHTALLAARHILEADLTVVIQGPGNLGTQTRWGFSGVAAGEALNAAAVLRGSPVAGLRVSQADARARHRGLSHHSITAFGRVVAHPADLVVPDPRGARGELAQCLRRVATQAAELADAAPHLRLRRVPTTGLAQALERSPVRLHTMGRGLAEDPASFIAAAAAGRYAATLLK